MNQSTLAAALLATPFAHTLLPLASQLLPLLQPLGQLVEQFRSQPVTPATAAAFERAVADLHRQAGRAVLEWTFNHLEPEEPTQAPGRLVFEGTAYRRRGQHPNTLATLCGPVTLQRLLDEPCERGERCPHPLERRLGVVAGCATAALAERAGQWVAQQPQRAVLAILRRDHGVCWSREESRR